MSSVQPQWITPAGDLGTIPENIFYRVSLEATAGDQDVFFRLIAGELPAGVQVTENGAIEGVPRTIVNVQGVPQEVNADVRSRFAVRAFTRRLVNGVFVIDRLADRTFELTVTGQNIPTWVTPAGNVGTFFDGSSVDLQLEFSDPDPDDTVQVRLLSGSLPPGVVLDGRTGRLSGVISPVIGPPGTAPAGYDATAFDQFAFDFGTRAASRNFQFTLAITDGKESNIRTFTIFVYAKNQMSADNTDITADNSFITADVTPSRSPILITPAGSIGSVRADNYFAFQFRALDFDGDAIEYSIGTGIGVGYDEGPFDATGTGFDQGTFALPPGLQLDADTGWLYGYIPDQGATENTYRFAITARKVNQPALQSSQRFYTITIIGNIETEVIWLTPPDLGEINNGAVSELSVSAFNVGGRSLQYRLAPGSASRLPQGLTLLPSGNIVGRVSFNTFCVDGGDTTFDRDLATRLTQQETTWDLQFSFTVNAFASEAQQLIYAVSDIVIFDGGSGYVSQPVITISAPPDTDNSIQATAGLATISGGVITNIALGNPGRGYSSPPTITISGGGGTGAVALARVQEISIQNPVSVFRTFTVTVARRFNQPYETLYIKAMPPQQDRALIESLIQNQDLIPENLVYRADDPNFGVAQNVIYNHAYGLTASTIAEYVQALDLNHYLKDLLLGPIRTAQALDAQGQAVYEVVYSEIVDDLVNSQGESVGKSVVLPYAVSDPLDISTDIDTVYPNSLINMRDQVIDTVGQISPALPRWMTSKQKDGRVLGFRPAWVIAYVKPGESGRIAYNIRRQFGDDLNRVDFETDRYILDRSQTRNWDAAEQSWIPSPPEATTFDVTPVPSQLNFLRSVDYVTELPFVDINKRTLDYIAQRGGIDGDIGRQLKDRTLIFQRQENFGNLTPDQAFTRVILPYDPLTRTAPPQVGASVSYDVTGQAYDQLPYNTISNIILSGTPDPLDGLPGSYDVGLFDESMVLPTAQRLWIYRMDVSDDNLVTLVPVAVAVVSDYVTIRRGQTARNDVLFLPTAPSPGLTLITWSFLPAEVTTPTIFDGNTTTFAAPADRWLATDEFDKYLLYPKRTILG